MNQQHESSIKILIVDDIEEMRRVFRVVLQLEPDFTIIGEACNGREGVEQAIALKPDVIIMNQSMPEMTGIDATSQIMSQRPRTAIIMVTGYNTWDYKYAAKQAGVYAYFVKPVVDFEKLFSAIRNGYAECNAVASSSA